MRVCGSVGNISPKGDEEDNGRGQDSPLLVVMVVDFASLGEDFWTSALQFLGASSPIPSLFLPLCGSSSSSFPPHSFSLHVHVKVQHQQLGLLCAVAAAHRAHQLGVGGPDTPHHTAAAAALQGHQVSDKLACLQVPQFNCAIVRAGDDKVLVELEAGHSALVLVGT